MGKQGRSYERLALSASDAVDGTGHRVEIVILDADEPTLASLPRGERLVEVSNHARRLFREQGYEATTIDEIAERAGISRRTFFNYFESKAAAFWHGGTSEHQDLTEAVERASGAADPWEAVVSAHVAWASAFGDDRRDEYRDLFYLIDTSPDLRRTLYDLNERAAIETARSLTSREADPVIARMTHTAALAMAFCGEQTQRAWSRGELDDFPGVIRSSYEAISRAFREAIRQLELPPNASGQTSVRAGPETPDESRMTLSDAGAATPARAARRRPPAPTR